MFDLEVAMFDITNIKSLSDFNRNSKEHVARLRESGEPEVLTVHGEAAVVVQDATAYQELLRKADFKDTVDAIRKGMAVHERGEGIDFLNALEGLASKNGISLQSK